MSTPDWHYPKCVLVTYGTCEPFRKRKIPIPGNLAESDLSFVLKTVYSEMMADGSVYDCGGNENSRLEDLIMYYYDEDFQSEVEWPRNSTLKHLEKNLILKVRNHRPGVTSGSSNSCSRDQLTQNNMEEEAEDDTPRPPEKAPTAIEPSPMIAEGGGLNILGLSSALRTSDNNVQSAIAELAIRRQRRQFKGCAIQDITLPNFDSFVDLEKQGNLHAHRKRFLRVHAEHLMQLTFPMNPSKALYTFYAQLIVERYPTMKNDGDCPWASVKNGIIKCIGNKKYYQAKGLRKRQARLMAFAQNHSTTSELDEGSEGSDGSTLVNTPSSSDKFHPYRSVINQVVIPADPSSSRCFRIQESHCGVEREHQLNQGVNGNYGRKVSSLNAQYKKIFDAVRLQDHHCGNSTQIQPSALDRETNPWSPNGICKQEREEDMDA